MCTGLDIEATVSQVFILNNLPVEVKVLGDAHPVGNWVVFKGCGYASEDDARNAGKRLGDALLIEGAVGWLGIDIGFNRNTLQFSDVIHNTIKEKSGRELKGEMHGLMVFEEDSITIIGLDARGSTSVKSQTLKEKLDPWFFSNKQLTERQKTCAALLNNSFFVPSADTQFVLRISEIETLCEEQQVGPETLEIIVELVRHLETLKVSNDVISRTKERLNGLRRESINQLVKMKFENLLTAKEAEAFKALSRLRGKLLHGGKGRGELAEAAGKALELGTTLLKADLSTV